MTLPSLRQVLRPAAAASLSLALGLGACGGDEEPTGSGTGGSSSQADDATADEEAPEEEAPADTSTVEVGDVVLFIPGDEGIYGVIVGDLDGYTVTSGLNGAFRFDLPGTYAVREDIAGNTATITVE